MLPVVWTSSRGSLKINSMLCTVREPTALPSYKRRRTDDESDPTVPWSPQYVEHLINVKTKFVYEHLKYCTCPLRFNDAPGLNVSWNRAAGLEEIGESEC
eukprot:scaffold6174_cov125-Isochrysis_galbana.AAC.8